MQAIIVLLLLLISSISSSQPTLEWSSQTYYGVSNGGWLVLRENPLEIRFYLVDSTQVLIMDGEYSSSVAVAIPKTTEEYDYLYSLGYDVTGDGIYDFYFVSQYLEPLRWGFRILNPINGETVFVLDDPSYSYYLVFASGIYGIIPDIDNDGFNEIMVRRWPTDSLYTHQYFVYNTDGISQSVFGREVPQIKGIALNQNYPNPFNPNTRISYNLAQPGGVQIQIFDIAGRLVRSFTFIKQHAGLNELIWDGRDNYGSFVSSGVYFYRVIGQGISDTKKMIILR